MKKFVAAVFAVTLAVSAQAAATVSDQCPGVSPIPGQTACNFIFWDGAGDQVSFTPTSFHFVTSASGNQTQVLKGVGIFNGTDAPVVYSAFGGSPIPFGQTCWNFQKAGSVTTNWQMVIEVDGNWTLTCNFSKACNLTGTYSVTEGQYCKPVNGPASIGQTVTSFVLTNECGTSATGTMTGPQAFTATWPVNTDITAIVSNDCNTIHWTNGSVWQRQ